MTGTTAVLDDTFYALSHGVRRDMLERLARSPGGACVTELAEKYALSLNGVSKHIKVLERAGLVARSREGRVHRLAMDPRPLGAASELIARYQQFWEGRLDALAEYLERPGGGAGTTNETRTERKPKTRKKKKL